MRTVAQLYMDLKPALQHGRIQPVLVMCAALRGSVRNVASVGPALLACASLLVCTVCAALLACAALLVCACAAFLTYAALLAFATLQAFTMLVARAAVLASWRSSVPV